MRFYYKTKKNESGDRYFYIEEKNITSATNNLKEKNIKPIGRIGEYLNEAKMYFILSELYNKENIEIGPTINRNGIRCRPDFLIIDKNETLVFEFDGPQHYTSATNCLKDVSKDKLYKELGYKIIRIPFFIQFQNNDDAIEVLLEKKYPFKDNYPHGFIDANVIFPADFCELGIERFKKDIEKFTTMSPLQKVQFFASTLECRKNYFSDYSEFIFPMQF